MLLWEFMYTFSRGLTFSFLLCGISRSYCSPFFFLDIGIQVDLFKNYSSWIGVIKLELMDNPRDEFGSSAEPPKIACEIMVPCILLPGKVLHQILNSLAWLGHIWEEMELLGQDSLWITKCNLQCRWDHWGYEITHNPVVGSVARSRFEPWSDLRAAIKGQPHLWDLIPRLEFQLQFLTRVFEAQASKRTAQWGPHLRSELGSQMCPS